VCGKVGKITLEKIWSKTTQSFSLQTTRKDILTHDSSFTQYRTLPELYPDGSTCFVMAYSHYGCQAEVITIDKEHRGRIQLSVIEPMVGFFLSQPKSGSCYLLPSHCCILFHYFTFQKLLLPSIFVAFSFQFFITQM
jgi:hypothetical protein